MRVRSILMVVFVICACRGGGIPPATPPLPSDERAAASTDVYLHRFGQHAVFNITNRAGYDNQPGWDGNSRLMYTLQYAGQTDIAAIDFESATNANVTTTPESEYSAATTPDGKAITVVRVERDSTQRLWRFPKEGGTPSLVLRDIKPVGYFAWLDTNTVALFVLGSPNTLQIADTRTGVGRVVTTNIGRSLQRVPRSRRASYLHRVDNKWVLETVDPTPLAGGGFDVDTIAVMPDSADFVVWRSATELYTAAGSRILRMRLPNRSWTLVDDFSDLGIRRISRLALSPDGRRLAFVADEPTPAR
jgi:hypothetical protein